MKVFERLRETLIRTGVVDAKLAEKLEFRRLRYSEDQRASGAWSWSASFGGFCVGSQCTATECAKAKRFNKHEHGDLNPVG